MRALIAGVGGLGCSAAPVLAAAGAALTLCDFDLVEAHNLGRQDLYSDADIGFLKVECAADALAATGASVRIEPRPFDATMLAGHDVLLDCTDDPASRAYIHDSCVKAGAPLAWAAVDGADGQVAYIPPGGPCLRCLWPEVGAGRPCDDQTDADVMRTAGRMQAEVALAAGPAGVLRLLSDEDVEFGVRQGCSCQSQPL